MNKSITDINGNEIGFRDIITDQDNVDYLVDKEVGTGRLILSNNQNLEDGSQYYLDESKLIFKISKKYTKNYQPISIWDYNTGVFNYDFSITHDIVNTEEAAYQIANYDYKKFGIFINKDKLPERVLEFGAILEDGSYVCIPKNKVTVRIMKPQALERLAQPIPIDTEENKNKAIEALTSMNEAYMITDDDYMPFDLPLERIENSINITPEKPMFFDSIAYEIKPLPDKIKND